ncbi:MAG: hypothetical protein EXR11_12835 [Rhodospirillaceae bacterium]|nr:hypothetical protein [Rhodospirillaceae bacterium]
MTPTSRRNGYSFKEGLTMLAAKAIGIDPELAAEAGENAKAAINAIRKAHKARSRADRAAFVSDAQAELKSINPSKHPNSVP